MIRICFQTNIFSVANKTGMVHGVHPTLRVNLIAYWNDKN